MYGRQHQRVKKYSIYVRGLGVIEVRETAEGIADEAKNLYKRQPDGSFEKVELGESKTSEDVDLKSLEPFQNVVLSDGSTWRNQPDKDGKFNLVLVAKPKYFKTLSPNDPSRHGKHSKSSK